MLPRAVGFESSQAGWEQKVENSWLLSPQEGPTVNMTSKRDSSKWWSCSAGQPVGVIFAALLRHHDTTWRISRVHYALIPSLSHYWFHIVYKNAPVVNKMISTTSSFIIQRFKKLWNRFSGMLHQDPNSKPVCPRCLKESNSHMLYMVLSNEEGNESMEHFLLGLWVPELFVVIVALVFCFSFQMRNTTSSIGLFQSSATIMCIR